MPTTAGAKTLTASYAGSTNFAGSTSSPGTPHTVNPAGTTTTITSHTPDPSAVGQAVSFALDRKSTRLNSSHSQISYAVFCLKKKKIYTIHYYDDPLSKRHKLVVFQQDITKTLFHSSSYLQPPHHELHLQPPYHSAANHNEI